MLGEAKETNGIGVKTAHNIPYTFIRKQLRSRLPTSANNAKQKSITEYANVRNPI